MADEKTTPTAEENAADTSAADTAKENTPDAAEQQTDKTAPKPEKTFTQAEVNAMIEKRLARERTSAESKADKALNEIAALKNVNACYKAGIKDECIDDAITLAGKLTDDKTDFSAALKKVMEKYPQFKAAASAPNITTGTKTSNSSDSDDKALRAAFGLK